MRKLIAFLMLTLVTSFPAQARDLLKIGISGYPETLHPAFSSSAVQSYIHGFVLRPVTAFDHDWKIACFMCADVPSFENGLAKRVALADGGEGVELTFTLPANAKWGDGVPLTSRDVAFSITVGQHPDVPVANQEVFNRIVGFESVDDQTFKVTMDRIDYTYQSFGGVEILPEHLERPVFEQDPATYQKRSLYVTAPATPGLWFGPYIVSDVVTASAVMLDSNPYWWGQKPDIAKIQLRNFENTTALEASLRTGEIDYASGETGMALDKVIAFERRFTNLYDISYQKGLSYYHLDANQAFPPLDDRRVRQALLLAIDRTEISTKLFAGKNTPTLSFIHPDDPVFTPDVARYDFNPEQAGRLLDDAGWTRTDDRPRTNADGDVLRLTLYGATESSTGQLIQQVLQNRWKQIGVEVDILNQPARVLFGETLPQRKFDGLAIFGWLSAPEHLPLTILRSDQVPTADNLYEGQNYTGYTNPRVDELIDAIELELDFDKRLPLWHELQKIYAQDLPALPLYHGENGFIFPKWLKGIRPTGHMYPSSLWAEEWYIIR
ncbi:peptide ABC transporter substrate-binding protein [Thalassospira sp.]|uniref:peptide ABC transporter substrate-binding protein n=1 Tax=Thalassospira sp. TaxID=1912094 RepID=UPI0027338F78|nr:peptide ABC transporter substrate-binding protein [Thalassospira sp.]MDP2696799.1 peptide ABC transporter substrate-binding protein [Thalassospira sp.]